MPDYTPTLLDAGKTIATAAIGAGAHWLWEWRKPVLCHLSNWELTWREHNALGAQIYSEKRGPINDARYSLRVEFFNKKSKVIGLRLIAIEFTVGRWPWRKTLFRSEAPYHEHVRVVGHQLWAPTLQNLELAPHGWTVESMHGFFQDTFQLSQADAVRFVAETAEGRKKIVAGSWIRATAGQPLGFAVKVAHPRPLC